MPRIIPSLYRHEQAVPALVWDINHKLGGNGGQGIPIIDVTVDNNGVLEKMISGSTFIVDSNNVQITFSEPRAGYAVIIS